MSVPKSKDTSANDSVIEAIDNAPLDAHALSPEEAEEFAALVAAGRGEPDVHLSGREMTYMVVALEKD